MFRMLLALVFLSSASYAAPKPQVLNATTPENIPVSVGSASMQYMSASTVVTLTVPYFASGYIMNGDPAWVCDNSKRCNPNSFPSTSVSQTGWTFMPQARNLVTNLQVSQSIVGVYVRPQDLVSSTAQNLVGFEWFCQGTCQ